VGARISASNIRGGQREFGPQNLLDGDRYSYWSTDDGVTTPTVELTLPDGVRFSVVRLRENIRLGQRIEGFAIDAWGDNDWRTIAAGTSIGPCRLIRVDEPVATNRVRLRVTQSPVCPALSEFALFAGGTPRA
jgi:alpha-L-fucosidase